MRVDTTRATQRAAAARHTVVALPYLAPTPPGHLAERRGIEDRFACSA
jgi:hypothetical protein